MAKIVFFLRNQAKMNNIIIFVFMADHNEVGKRGEEIAAKFLEGKGYTILARNWKRQHAEIDIIASDADYIVFVEVKTRSSRIWGEPLDAVSDQKMRQIVKGASLFIEENDIGNLDPRFDLISVILDVEIDHIVDAFYPKLE